MSDFGSETLVRVQPPSSTTAGDERRLWIGVAPPRWSADAEPSVRLCVSMPSADPSRREATARVDAILLPVLALVAADDVRGDGILN